MDKPNIDKIEKKEITEELRESYLDYAMSVIVSRALPDVRDGLKPVQRRILWAMWDIGLTHAAKFKKSANVVGEVLGKYHPHGDIPVYDAMSRMAQNFSLRYPLIDGQGNWGSVDGDAPAAMRYCVTGDALVVTDKGLMPIKELGDKFSNESDINLSILSKDRNINKAVKWFNSGEHPTIKITTQNGFSLTGSLNHPILTWIQNPFTKEPRLEWKLLSQLKINDIAVIDRTSNLLWPERHLDIESYKPIFVGRRAIKKLPSELDENLAFIAGALVAEGTVKENKIEFCNSDKDFIEAFSRSWQEVFPDCRLHHFKKAPNSFGKKPYETFEIHSRQVVEFLRNLGLRPVKSSYRKMPEAIFQSPKKVAAAFLRGYFEGDGSISFSGKMTELSCISKSETLIDQLQILLLRFGIAGTKRFDRWRNVHKLYVRGLSNYKAFADEIGFVSTYKDDKLKRALSRIHKDYSQTDFVPFISNFSRSYLTGSYSNREFAIKHNFDRYASMTQNHSRVASLVKPETRVFLSKLFAYLLKQNYLFEPIAKIEDGGIQRVYSLKIQSNCHSFVTNGFINHNTEARLTKIAGEILEDVEKETVDWQPNYDNSRLEPKFLPAKLPNLILNGTLGIAVGMATSIPPHNLSEVTDALIYLSDNPEAKTKDLMKFIPGPDFPTGGIIYNEKSIEEAYSTGRGSITTRAAAIIEERKTSGFQIVITEIPYQVNKSDLVAKIAALVQEKRIEGIRDLRDESDREGMRIVVELRGDSVPQKVLNQLFEYTELQKNFYFNTLALVDGLQPKILSLKELLVHYLEHRKLTVRRRTEFDLKKAQERAHILTGLVKALEVIDKVIALIKKSRDRAEAHKNLVEKFRLTPIQADAILEMKLQTLAALERQKIEDELKEKKKFIAELELILRHPKKIIEIINQELLALKNNYGGSRKTKLVAHALKEFNEEDLIPEEEMVIALTEDGYVKRMTPTSFRTQRRGGKGLIGQELKEEDQIHQILQGGTHDNILFFTDRGKVFQTKVYEIPAGSRTSKGKSIYNFLEIPATEKISAIITYSGKTEKQFLVMVTKNGVIKKTAIAEFGNVRKNGIQALRLQTDDLLKWVKLSSGDDQIIIATERGQSIRFKEKDIRPMSRSAGGVQAIRLKNDFGAGLDIIKENLKFKILNLKLLVVMANGFAKQTPLKEYKIQRRGGSGIKTAKITEKTGPVMAAVIVGDEIQEVIAFSKKGQALRTKLSDIRIASRATQGVKIMNLEKDDKLMGIVCL